MADPNDIHTTLARLSFWVPPERLDDFAAVYERQLVPILGKHGLVESAQRGRQTAAGVFDRLFAMASPAEIHGKQHALLRDSAWESALQNAGVEPGIADTAGRTHWRLSVYRAPAGPGETVEAGSGTWRESWQRFGAQDGFPVAMIMAFAQDRQDRLWFASYSGGASCFDGSWITTFTTADGLTSDEVWYLIEDRRGNLWFATEEGVSRYDGKSFETFTAVDGLGSDWVWYLFEDREGNLWFGTNGGGVSRYDGKDFATFTIADGLAHDNVSAILEDEEGCLWFGTGGFEAEGGGVSRYDGKDFATFTTADGLPHDNIFSMVKDRKQNLWFITNGGGVSRYDGKDFHNLTTRDGLASDQVMSAVEDSQGNLWFSTWPYGVSRYDGSSFTCFTRTDGLEANHVNRMLEDRQGHLWFGTWNGIRRFAERHNAAFSEKDGLPSSGVTRILEDRAGDLWFGTWNGVCRYDGTRFVRLDEMDGINVHAMLEDGRGHLWFGTFNHGLIRYDGERYTHFLQEHDLPRSLVTSLVEDRDGCLWFSYWGAGVIRYDGERIEIFTPAQGLAHSRVWTILEDRNGHLWFGTRGGGVSRYDGEKFVNFTTAEGLAHDNVNSILEDRNGHLWFGTWDGGISRFDGETFANFGVEEGLAHSHVRAILEDRDGHLWIGTWGGGISRFDGTAFQHLNRQSGLLYDVVQDIIQDRNGYIWIATEGGVNRYLPQRASPSVQLIGVSADRRYEPAAEIGVPASQKLITFSFRGRSWTTSQDQLAYVCRLEGYDDNWQTTRRRRAEYHDLPIGEYTFEVKAVDRDLNYSEASTVRLTVEPDPHRLALTEALSNSSPSGEFIGNSRALRQVHDHLAQVATTDLTVLILGETGTGKGLAARTLHQLSNRKNGPFVQVNCGALPDTLVESELFGHEKGAFTGAHARKLGKVELAREGTLLLDEIGDMPLDAQVKLLRLLEEGTFERVGGERTLSAEVRVVAATNRDLQQRVQEGEFREDLYFRLAVFPVRLPPLRERQEDIPLLALYFMERMAAHLDKEVSRLDEGAVSALQRYGWPGNVRELEHALQRAVIVCRGSTVRAADIGLESGMGLSSGEVVPLEEFERRYIREVLERAGWVISGAQGAAALLGVNPSTLRGRMRKLGIQRE